MHLSRDGIELGRSGPDLEVRVDWAPAYELVMSLSTFLNQSHGMLELGSAWATEIRSRLPHDLVQRLSRKPVLKAFKEHTFDQLMLLVQAAPGPRDVPSFIEWFAHLTAGAAYEALAPIAAEPGPQLARDFTTWRDSVAEVLAAWNDNYFATLDPAILRGLNDAADALRRCLPPADGVSFVEEVTNGVVLETSPTLREVLLVPQYHHRPYNESAEIRCGSLILFPCDVLPSDPERPSANLMRLTHALGDESRLRMLRFLGSGPCSLTEVARQAGLSQPTVHHHLVQLRAAGLVRVHCVTACGPSRYSLRPHALEQLSTQLGAYLLSDTEADAR